MIEFLNAIQRSDSSKALDLLRSGAIDKILAIDDLLATCARYNQDGLIEQLVTLGAPIDLFDGLGLCPLHYCAARNLIRATYVLVHSDAQVDLTDPSGRSPLMLSIYFNHPEIFDILVTKTKDINTVEENGKSALRIAVDKGLVEFVRILIEKNAFLNLPDALGWTPLLSAAAMGNEEIFSMLVKGGADIRACDNEGRSVLFVAGAFAQVQIVEQLLQAGVELDLKDAKGDNVEHFILGDYQEEIIQYIRGTGEDLMDGSKIVVEGETPKADQGTEFWKISSKVAILNSILSDEVNREKIDTPLRIPVESVYGNLFDLLLQSGLHLNRQNAQMETALHLALKKGVPSVVTSLLESGADAHLKNLKGQTAVQLIEAMETSAPEAFKHAINALKSDKLTTPIETDAALQSPQNDAAKIPPDTHSLNHNAFMLACGSGNLEALRVLIKSGQEIIQKDFQGRTGLMLAAAQGHNGVVAHLLSLGMRPDIKDTQGTNALAFAIANQQFEVVQTLCNGGADVNARLKGIPMLMIAIAKGDIFIAKYLVEKGANVREKDYHGGNALKYAVASQSTEMVQFVETALKATPR